MVNDVSDLSSSKAHLEIDSEEKDIDFLIGFAIFLFHTLKINPNIESITPGKTRGTAGT
jgi:hypothetical protein